MSRIDLPRKTDLTCFLYAKNPDGSPIKLIPGTTAVWMLRFAKENPDFLIKKGTTAPLVGLTITKPYQGELQLTVAAADTATARNEQQILVWELIITLPGPKVVIGDEGVLNLTPTFL